MNNYALRSKQFHDRANALDDAATKERRIRRLLNGGLLAMLAFAISVSWTAMTVRLLILEATGLFVLRWVALFTIYFTFTKPTIQAIDAKFPSPNHDA